MRNTENQKTQRKQASETKKSYHKNGTKANKKVNAEARQKASQMRELRRQEAIKAVSIDELVTHLNLTQDGTTVCPSCKSKDSLVLSPEKYEFKCSSCKQKGHTIKLVKLSLGLTDWKAVAYLEELNASRDSSPEESSPPTENQGPTICPLCEAENSIVVNQEKGTSHCRACLEKIPEESQPQDPPPQIPSKSTELTDPRDKHQFKERVEQIKQMYNIKDVIEREAGVNFKRVGSNFVCRCPFRDHEDRNPSFTIPINKEQYHCFGCGRKGDVLTFLMEYRGCKFNEALSLLDRGSNCSPLPKPILPKSPEESLPSVNPVRRKELMTRCRDFFYNRLMESDAGKAFLYERGLWSQELVSFFKLGFDDGRINQAITEEVVEELMNLGLINEKQNSRFYQCLTVGLQDEEGNVVGLYGRRINSEKGSKHQFPKENVQGILNVEAFKASREMIFTEGFLDAFSVWVMKRPNVSCLFSASSIPALLIDLLTRYQVERVYLALDNDQAGETACRRFAEAVANLEIELKRISFPEGIKDANEFLLHHGREKAQAELDRLIAEAKPYPQARETLPLKTRSEPTVAPQLQWEQKNGAVQGKLLHYNIEMLSHERGAMRILLTASRNGTIYTDKLDMFRSQARQSFASTAARRFSLPVDPLTRELETVLSLLRHLPTDKSLKVKKKEDNIPLHTKEEEQVAMAWLRDPEFFKRIPRDCDILGYVGEDKVKLILYICASSRKQEHPIPSILRGLSGGGKTALMEIIASLIPPEEVIFLSELSRQSLFYMGTEHLRHKLILVDESSGSEDAAYAIRTLLSRGVLRKAVPLKDPTGQMQTIIQETKGPIGYLEGSSASFMNPENENRCLVPQLNDSAEQTRRIHEAQRNAFTAEGRQKAREAVRIRRIHQVAQRLLKPCKVDIPYVHLLTFPSHWPRTRRDHHKFLLLLSTITYLHQYQRKQYREEGALIVVADIQDYRYAYELAPMILLPAVSDLTDKHQELLEDIDRYVEAQAEKLQVSKDDIIFTRGEISRCLNLQLHQLRSYLPLLVELEYLLQLGSANKGTTFKYRRNYHLPDPTNPMTWLITPAKLEQKIASDSSLQPVKVYSLKR